MYNLDSDKVVTEFHDFLRGILQHEHHGERR